MRSVITVAVGSDYYKSLAINLYKSFILWNKNNDIQFQIITDNIKYFEGLEFEKLLLTQPKDINAFESFTSKFIIYKESLNEENLFIDCDCIIYGDITFIFEKFKNQNFSAIGTYINQGSFFCDVENICNYFGIEKLPKFVGSVYYFKKNSLAESVFYEALKLKANYDQLGFVRLRNKENEEPLFAVSMALNSEKLIMHDGTVKADAMYYKSIKTNVQSGKCNVSDANFEIVGGEEILQKGRPAILHFNDSFTNSITYLKDAYRLKSNNHTIVNECILFIKYDLFNSIKSGLKNILRPVYHLIFGNRNISVTDRAS